MDKHVEKEDAGDGKVNWLNLPDDLIASISDQIFLVKDYIRFGAVCRSWRSVYTDNLDRHCPPRRLPLLMVPPPSSGKEDDGLTRNLYSISVNALIPDIKLNVPHERFCRGSSEGWLITLHKNLTDIGLLHPFSGVEIELPPSTALPHGEREISNEGFIDKAILSVDPSLNPNYVVMVIYGQQNRLALFKPGDPTWTPLDFSFTVVEDVIYWRDSFYAVNFNGKICAYDPHHPHPELVELAQLPETFLHKKKYLVGSDGGLLLIVRSRKIDEDDGYKRTLSFEVFKLKQGSSPTTLTSTWTPLQSLGGQALFLGTNSSLSLLASDFPGCKPDCIYFTDDDFEWLFDRSGCLDMGLFNLVEGTFEKHLPLKSNVEFPDPIWI